MLKLVNTKEFLTNFDLRQIDQKDALAENDRILIGTTEGNQAISVKDFYFALLDEVFNEKIVGGSARRNIYRGREIGRNGVTDEQWGYIADGSYRNMFCGDYWYLDDNLWRIMDFEYIHHSENDQTNHLIIVPDFGLLSSIMGKSGTNTSGGYAGSEVYKNISENSNILPRINRIFGEEHIMPFWIRVSNSVNQTEYTISSVLDVNIKAALMSSVMVFGHHTSNSHHTDVSDVQLAGFEICPKLINYYKYNWWLREPLNNIFWMNVYPSTLAAGYAIDINSQIRPFFALYAGGEIT